MSSTAFTGVVNIVPRRDPLPLWARLAGGSHGRVEGTIGGAFRRDGKAANGSIHARSIDGWRDHSEWRGVSGLAMARRDWSSRTRTRPAASISTPRDLPSGEP